MLSEGNQIHNLISSSGSGTVINYGSGSDFLTSYGSGSGSTRQKVMVATVPVPVPVPQHWLTRCQLKRSSSSNFFCLLLFEGTFTSVIIDKKSRRGHEKVEIKVFLTFFACLWKDPDPYKIMTDPDPQHWYRYQWWIFCNPVFKNRIPFSVRQTP